MVIALHPLLLQRLCCCWARCCLARCCCGRYGLVADAVPAGDALAATLAPAALAAAALVVELVAVLGVSMRDPTTTFAAALCWACGCWANCCCVHGYCACSNAIVNVLAATAPATSATAVLLLHLLPHSAALVGDVLVAALVALQLLLLRSHLLHMMFRRAKVLVRLLLHTHCCA